MVLSFSSSRDYCRRFSPLRISTFAEPDFSICWMKLYSIVITTAPCVFFNRKYNKFGETCSCVFSCLSFLFTGICPWDVISPGAKSVRSKWKKKQAIFLRYSRIVYCQVWTGFSTWDISGVFFLSWFTHVQSRFTRQQGKGEAIYLTPLYHFHPLHRHLTTGWLQGRLSLSSFRGRSSEYQDFLETVVESKLPPRSGSLALRQLNPIRKKGS